MAGVAVAAMLASQELFQRDTWPVVLSREIALGICGKGADMAQLDALIRGREVGPASFLAMANIFGMLRNPAIARELAKQGIRELKPEGFRKDAAVIISGDRLLGKTTLALAAALRESSDDDIEAIASRLNPAEAALLRDCARLLKATPDKPLADALAPALDAWWSAALRQPIGEALAGVAFDQE